MGGVGVDEGSTFSTGVPPGLTKDTPNAPPIAWAMPFETAVAIDCAWAGVRFFGLELLLPHASMTSPMLRIENSETTMAMGEDWLRMNILQRYGLPGIPKERVRPSPAKGNVQRSLEVTPQYMA